MLKWWESFYSLQFSGHWFGSCDKVKLHCAPHPRLRHNRAVVLLLFKKSNRWLLGNSWMISGKRPVRFAIQLHVDFQRFGELYCKTYSNDRSTQGRKSMRIYSFKFHGSLIISMKGIALFISLIFFHSMFFRRRIEAHMINFRKERLAVIGKLSLVAVNRNLAFASHQELRV